uniref:Uncharacterized protein n=1 Tax=Rousettus aegyptiacus TaxID=9407 RepID=A0A7J8DXN3_ROUAE|nr:hypothetical protein HJG63_008313 [Rousettus aegyptiacus]
MCLLRRGVLAFPAPLERHRGARPLYTWVSSLCRVESYRCIQDSRCVPVTGPVSTASPARWAGTTPHGSERRSRSLPCHSVRERWRAGMPPGRTRRCAAGSPAGSKLRPAFLTNRRGEQAPARSRAAR